MPVTADKPGPYAPASGILTLVERHRNKGLPAPVDADVLARAGISESLIPRTLQALQTLDLIDTEGRVTQVMEGLRLAPEAEYKARMAEWLNAAYHDALQFIDPAVDDETRILDAFRNYVPVGQRDRMVTTFVGLYTAAGVRPERARPAPGSRTPRERPAANNSKPAAKQAKRVQANNPPPPLPPHTGLPPALAGLLSSLPSSGASWTKAERDRFLVTFGAVLDFCYPIDNRPKRQAEQENEDEGEAE
jgi:hypothetical protein